MYKRQVLLNTAVYLLFAIIEMMIAQLLELPIGDSTILMSVSGAHTLSFILSLLMSIGSFLLMVPLNLGIMRWYHSLSDGVSEDIMGIFSCFANRKMFFRSLWPVSYTHLDVYKRQSADSAGAVHPALFGVQHRQRL